MTIYSIGGVLHGFLPLTTPPPDRLPTSSKGSGIIESVVGHGTARGIPEAHEITLRQDDGSVLQARMPTPTGDQLTANILRLTPNFVDFGRCPLCLDLKPKSREHVPPRAIGGNVLTMTCERCNNEFGSRFEPSLLAWYERSLGRVRVSGGSVPGNRRGGEFLLRQTSDGTPVLFETGGSDPAVDEIFRSGEIHISFVPVDTKAVHVAVVKSAYLAACVLIGEIPNTPRAKAIREELVAARDRHRDAKWEPSPLLQSIQTLPSDATPVPGEVRLAEVSERNGPLTYAITFNRAFGVEWPLERAAAIRLAEKASDLT